MACRRPPPPQPVKAAPRAREVQPGRERREVAAWASTPPRYERGGPSRGPVAALAMDLRGVPNGTSTALGLVGFLPGQLGDSA
jgi:hypothetical protein